MTRSRKKKNPFVANHLWEKKRKGQDEGGEINNSNVVSGI